MGFLRALRQKKGARAAIAWSSHCMEQALAGGSHGVPAGLAPEERRKGGHCMEQSLAGGSHGVPAGLAPEKRRKGGFTASLQDARV